MSLNAIASGMGHAITKPVIPILGGISILGAGILAGAGYLVYKGIKSVTTGTRRSIARTLGTL